MTEMVILQVLPSLQQGGVERGTLEIADALQKEGIKNYVVSQGGKMVPELEKLGVEHITLPVKSKNPFTMWLNSYRLEKLFKEKGITLVHVRSRAPAWSVKWACKRSGIPYVATFHGRYGLKPEVFKRPYNKVMTQGRVVVAVSTFIKNHLKEAYGIKEQHIRLIPRGADMNIFDPAKVTEEQVLTLAKEQGVSLDKPIITLVGRLSRIKGSSVLFDAVKQMKHKDVTLMLVGGNPKGDYKEEVEAAIASLPPETTVKMFALPGSRMPEVYALSTVVVQPTLVPESFGRGIVEAQAMGRIVVASNHGGACELIRNDQTGYLTPVGDAQVLAGVLDSILDMSVTERKEMEVAAHKSASNYSIQKMCERTLAMYREITKSENVKNDK